MKYHEYGLDFLRFKSKASPSRFRISWGERLPCLGDDTRQTGFDRHYVYHLAWAARVLAEMRPKSHLDISSSLHFCSMLSAFIPVKYYDYRPADLRLSDLECESADLTSLPFPDQSIASLSCMHVVEHIGLGRYGDPLDPAGDLKAIAELKRVLAVGGDLLFVVPIGGTPKILFNAHRIYSYCQIASYFTDLELVEFSLISGSEEGGGLIHHATKAEADGEDYGCGCFWFKRG
jgi:SAM-dependent methyltransferase